jgi:hypothetical protein
MNQKLSLSPLYKAILCHVLILGLVIVAHQTSPSGPCTPGLDVLLFFLWPILSFVLLLINLVKLYRGNKIAKYQALLHLLMIIWVLLYLKFG